MTWIANAPETPKMLQLKYPCPQSYHASEPPTGPSRAIFLIFLTGNRNLSKFIAIACETRAAEPGEAKGTRSYWLVVLWLGFIS